MDTIEKIKSFIATGDTEKAIELLVEYTREKKSPYHDQAVLLSGQFRQWKRDVTLGVQQSNSDLRRIEVGIMNILQEKSSDLKTIHSTKAKDIKSSVAAITEKVSDNRGHATTSTRPTPDEKTNKKPFIIGGVVLGLIILLVFIFSSSDPDPMDGDDFFVEQPTTIDDPTEIEDDPTTINDNPTVIDDEPTTNPPRSLPEVNGRNVNFVAFTNQKGAAATGYFRNLGNGKWVEEGPNFEQQYSYVEESRDDEAVYLFDENRNYEIELDLYHKELKLTDENNPESEQQLLYFQKEALSKMKGTYVKKVIYKYSSEIYGTFEQVNGTKKWLEKNPDTDERGTPGEFKEFARDEWSVYLRNSPDFEIQLDLYLNQVKLKEKNKEAQGLYSIVKGI